MKRTFLLLICCGAFAVSAYAQNATLDYWRQKNYCSDSSVCVEYDAVCRTGADQDSNYCAPDSFGRWCAYVTVENTDPVTHESSVSQYCSTCTDGSYSKDPGWDSTQPINKDCALSGYGACPADCSDCTHYS